MRFLRPCGAGGAGVAPGAAVAVVGAPGVGAPAGFGFCALALPPKNVARISVAHRIFFIEMSPLRKLPQGYPKKRPVARNLTGPSLYVSTFGSYRSPQSRNVRIVQSRNVRFDRSGPPMRPDISTLRRPTSSFGLTFLRVADYARRQIVLIESRYRFRQPNPQPPKDRHKCPHVTKLKMLEASCVHPIF